MRSASAARSCSNIWAVNALKRSLVIAALFAGMTAPAISSAEPLPTVQDVRRFAEDVVIGTQSGGRLVKWLRAPTVRLETMVPGPRDEETGRAIPIPAETPMQHYTKLRRHVTSLKELTGMSIRLMPRDIGSGGDIVVTVVPRTAMGQLPFPGVPEKTLARLMGPSRCFFLIWPNPDWSIQKARIVINSFLEEKHINHCFLEELTQSLGLPNDSERLRPSIFNETSMLTELSALDRILIRTVYDPRIDTGMNLGRFRETVVPIIGAYMSSD